MSAAGHASTSSKSYPGASPPGSQHRHSALNETPSVPSGNYGEQSMKLSYPNKGTTVLPATRGDLSKKFKTAILPFPIQHVADAANRTTEAVKKWRAEDACPDLPSAINAARDIPAVKWLIYEEIERGTPEGVHSTRLLTEGRALLQKLAEGEGEHAEAARKILYGGRK